MCGNVGVLLLNILRMILCATFDLPAFVDSCFKKIKTFRGTQKPHINKRLRKTCMKRWQLKSKA